MTYYGRLVFGNFKPTRDSNDPKYLALIRSMPSCISGKRPCHAHHLRKSDERGVGLKAQDRWTLPLTSDEHVGDIDCVHSVGSKLEVDWFRDRGVRDPYGLAERLYAARNSKALMRQIIEEAK